MSDLAVLNRIQSFLAAPQSGELPTHEESTAWMDFYQIHDPVIRAIVKHRTVSASDRDDLAQEIWALLIRRLPGLILDPDRGTLRAWIAAVARHHAGRHARRQSRRRHEVLTLELASFVLDPAASPVAEMKRASSVRPLFRRSSRSSAKPCPSSGIGSWSGTGSTNCPWRPSQPS